MLWSAEASSLAYIARLNPVTRKMAEEVANETDNRVVTVTHLHEALKRMELQRQTQTQNSPQMGLNTLYNAF